MYGSAVRLPRNPLRLLAATGVALMVVSVGGCGDGDEPTVETSPPATASPEAPGGLDLPEVASVAPQPEPVAATLGSTATIGGSDLFGTQSATIEVTLSGPEVIPEVKLPNGVVQKPKKDVFVVFKIVIEGVEGTYDFNPGHFHLIAKDDVAEWEGEAVLGLGDRPDTPVPIDALDSISFGSVSAGDRLSGNLVFDQPKAAVDNTAIVLRPLLLTEGRPSAYWSLG